MVSAPTHSDTFYGALATMAEKLRHTIIDLVNGERFQYLQQRVTESEIVFGVWPDPTGTGGFRFHLIKGRAHMAALLGELPDELTTTAIPCVGLEQAIAAEQVWGEPAPNSAPAKISLLGKSKKAKPPPKERRTSKESSTRSKRARRTRH